jgi:hypothetical protein
LESSVEVQRCEGTTNEGNEDREAKERPWPKREIGRDSEKTEGERTERERERVSERERRGEREEETLPFQRPMEETQSDKDTSKVSGHRVDERIESSRYNRLSRESSSLIRPFLKRKRGESTTREEGPLLSRLSLLSFTILSFSLCLLSLFLPQRTDREISPQELSVLRLCASQTLSLHPQQS